MTPFADLQSFARFLESQKELVRVKAEVDAELEISEIVTRVVKQRGPALLFENVKGSRFPLLINAFGSSKRIEWALGGAPGEWGDKIKKAADDFMPPKPSSLWKNKSLLWRATNMKPKFVGRAPVCANKSEPDLAALPVLKCWPDDGGRFITLPMVITQDPHTRKRNVGLYRMQLFDKSHTGMHWQIQKGGGFHYVEAERRGEDLPCVVALGADPILMLSAMFPLPEGIDEMAFAGFLRGAPTRLTRTAGGLEIPADAEMVLEGVVPARMRHMEGPFGDHFGHYSHAALFPIFDVQHFYHRDNAIYPATVVGVPPQEDKYMGDAAQELFTPLLKLMKPELVDLWAYYEAGFHNLAVASVRQRYKKEAVKTALSLFGEGQLSLTKCIILVDPGVNVRSFTDVLEAIRRHFDPKHDFILVPGTAQDTLDFTSFTMNLGSKMIIDATRSAESAGEPPHRTMQDFSQALKPHITAYRNWRDTMLVVQVKSDGRAVVESLLQKPELAHFKFIAAVSDDFPLTDDELLMWGIFTRFDCARDVVPKSARFQGAWPFYEGPLGIDATWKKGYPEPIVMDAATKEIVRRRWSDYGIF
jgi:menaquinone biosynthesis decarboxylase